MARITSLEEHARQSESRWQPDEVGVVLELQEKVQNLQVALATQRTIGVVLGLLAQRYGCTTAQAWRLLTRISQDANVKVRDIARVLVDSFDDKLCPEDTELLAVIGRHLPGRRWSGATRHDQLDRPGG